MSQATHQQTAIARDVRIQSGAVTLAGDLLLPVGAKGAVLFAQGSGSIRHSPRNHFLAQAIRNAGLGTLLFDLLTPEEEAIDIHTRHFRFNIDLLAERLINATYWLKGELHHLRIGFFGASTGAAAALVAAAELGTIVGAIVSRSGHPDLAEAALAEVKAPTLLIVGELDAPMIDMNRRAYAELNCAKEITIVPRATHLFKEREALEQVAVLAADWFAAHLTEEKHTEDISNEQFRETS